eukprot:IDg7606t1
MKTQNVIVYSRCRAAMAPYCRQKASLVPLAAQPSVQSDGRIGSSELKQEEERLISASALTREQYSGKYLMELRVVGHATVIPYSQCIILSYIDTDLYRLSDRPLAP